MHSTYTKKLNCHKKTILNRASKVNYFETNRKQICKITVPVKLTAFRKKNKNKSDLLS